MARLGGGAHGISQRNERGAGRQEHPWGCGENCRQNPALGRHFAAALSTGYFCAYQSDPNHPIRSSNLFAAASRQLFLHRPLFSFSHLYPVEGSILRETRCEHPKTQEAKPSICANFKPFKETKVMKTSALPCVSGSRHVAGIFTASRGQGWGPNERAADDELVRLCV